MFAHNSLVQIYYVQYTERTAGHMCVQSEIVFSSKSNAEEKHICPCCTCVLIVNVQYTESPAGNMCVKYEIVFSHNQMQSDSIYVNVALLLSE